MAKFVKGDVAVIPFPFSDLSATKRRPALIVAVLTGDDVILAQITSKGVSDSYSIEISNTDFSAGGLNVNSAVRPNRLFTADSNIILYKAGSLSQSKVQEVIDQIINIITS